MPRKPLFLGCREVFLEAEKGIENAAARDGAMERTEWAEKRRKK